MGTKSNERLSYYVQETKKGKNVYAMTRNFLLYQYGADQTQLIDPRYIKKYINYLDKEFHFIAGIIY